MMVSAVPLTNDINATGPADPSHTTPSIAPHPAGGYVIAWTNNNNDIFAARVPNPTWSEQAGVLVNTTTVSGQLFPAVTVLPSGMWVVAWSDQGGGGPDPDGSEWGIRGRLFAADGTPVGAEFLVNTTTLGAQWQSEVVPLAGGGFIVEWQNIDHIAHIVDSRAQIFDSSGSKVGGEIIVGSDNTSVAPLPGGGFLSAFAVYVAGSGSTSQYYIAAQRFDAAGNKVGPEFRVLNETTTQIYEIDTVTLATGGFVIAWVANGAAGDGSGKGLRAQVYDSAGAPVGTPVSLNSITPGDQFQLDMSALPGGGFAATWSDSNGSGGDNSSYSIKARLFDSTGAPVLDEFLVNSDTPSIQQNPAIVTLNDGHVLIGWQDHHVENTNVAEYDIHTRSFAVPLAGTEGADSFTGTRDVDQFIGRGGDDIFLFPVRPLGPLESGTPHRSTWGGDSTNNLDTVDGGAGYDRVIVEGDTIFPLAAQSLTGIEEIVFHRAPAGRMYPPRNITMHDGNVAAGATLRVDASALPYGESLFFYGQNELDGRFVVLGGANYDVIRGGQQSDDITGGLGSDELRGNGGDDIFRFGSLAELRGYFNSFTGTYQGDNIDGGAGSDNMSLTGDMSAGALFAVTMTGIESITVNTAGGGGAYHSYNITIANSMVAAGQSLQVSGSALGFGESLMFYGNAETDGSFTVYGGGGNDYIFGSQNGDTIRGGLSGDVLRGEGGSDLFLFGDIAEIRGDDIGGGAGLDTLILFGQMGAGALVGVTMTGIEAISLNSARGAGYFSYNLTMANSMVAAGQTLTVNGTDLLFGEALMFYGGAETDGHFIVLGGASTDYLYGGQSGDTIRGGLLGDYIQGNGGADILVYDFAAQSTSVNFDRIAGFDRNADRLDLPVAVTGFGGQVNQGRLASATFDADLAAAMSGVLGSSQAALFNPDSGDFAGRRFLLVDGDGQAGYQAGQDYVFELIGPTAPMTGTPDYIV